MNVYELSTQGFVFGTFSSMAKLEEYRDGRAMIDPFFASEVADGSVIVIAIPLDPAIPAFVG